MKAGIRLYPADFQEIIDPESAGMVQAIRNRIWPQWQRGCASAQ
jgi:hypothetical protein